LVSPTTKPRSADVTSAKALVHTILDYEVGRKKASWAQERKNGTPYQAFDNKVRKGRS
jgi:hypothetical protein